MKRIVVTIVSLSVLAGCMTPPEPEISCDPAAYTYSQSTVGLDFRASLRSPLAEILSEGEREYFGIANRMVVFGIIEEADIPVLWKNHVNALLSARIPDFIDSSLEPSIYFFRMNTPDMFQRLRACVNENDDVLSYIKVLPAYPELIVIRTSE